LQESFGEIPVRSNQTGTIPQNQGWLCPIGPDAYSRTQSAVFRMAMDLGGRLWWGHYNLYPVSVTFPLDKQSLVDVKLCLAPTVLKRLILIVLVKLFSMSGKHCTPLLLLTQQ
jgi:hypothetical protein